MKLADNMDRHEIFNKFNFWPDPTIHFRVACPWVPKVADNLDEHKLLDMFEFWPDQTIFFELKKTNTIFDLIGSVACLIFIQVLWNMLINRIGIKYLMSSKLGHIALFTLELPALDYWYVGLRWAIIAHWATC